MSGEADLLLHTRHHTPAVIVAVLIPVALRRAFAADIADAAAVDDEDPDAALTSAPLLHPRASLSLDSDVPHVQGTRRELLDGTTRSSTDGSARLKRYEDGGETFVGIGECRQGESGARSQGDLERCAVKCFLELSLSCSRFSFLVLVVSPVSLTTWRYCLSLGVRAAGFMRPEAAFGFPGKLGKFAAQRLSGRFAARSVLPLFVEHMLVQ